MAANVVHVVLFLALGVVAVRFSMYSDFFCISRPIVIKLRIQTKGVAAPDDT